MKYGVLSQEAFEKDQLWQEINATQGLWKFSSDLLCELGAEVAGESFICADGKLKLTPIKFFDKFEKEEKYAYLFCEVLKPENN